VFTQTNSVEVRVLVQEIDHVTEAVLWQNHVTIQQ
jgi:hypothetical protein